MNAGKGYDDWIGNDSAMERSCLKVATRTISFRKRKQQIDTRERINNLGFPKSVGQR